MPSDKPRIQGYLEPELYSLFKDWQALQGIKESEALNQILGEYFSYSPQGRSPLPSPFEIKEMLREVLWEEESFRIALSEKLWDEGKRDFIEGMKIEAQAMIAKQINEAKEFWQAIENEESIRELEARISAINLRIKALEKTLIQSEILLIAEKNDKPLTQSELAFRLGCHKSQISRRKDREDFKEWAKKLDPEGIGWIYNKEKKLFIHEE